MNSPSYGLGPDLSPKAFDLKENGYGGNEVMYNKLEALDLSKELANDPVGDYNVSASRTP